MSENGHSEADQAVDVLVDFMREMSGEDPDVITLTSGIKLRTKRVPLDALERAHERITRPQVPIVEIENKGRKEPNPDDPEYKKALKAYEEQTYVAAANVALVMGTEFLSAPDGWLGPQDDGWVDELDLLGIEADVSNPARRYHSWLKLYACRGQRDVRYVIWAVFTRTSLTEEEVGRAVLSFRSEKARQADHGGGGAAAAPHGDHDAAAVSGAGSAARGARSRKVRRGAVDGVGANGAK